MVKTILSASLITSLALASTCNENTKDIKSLVSCAKSELVAKNPDAKVYIQIISVPKSPSDPQYYDFLSAKYNEAFLKIKSNLAMKLSGKIITEEISKKNDKNKMPAELIEEKLNKTIELQRQALEEKEKPGIFDRIVNKILPKEPKDTEKADKELRIKAEEVLYSNEFKDKMQKVAKEEIAGLIPYENFVVTSDNGETELGIVAYTSKRSRELARALANGHKANITTNEAQCKNADTIIQELGGPDNKINKMGLKFFYNEACQPSLLAYGMDTYKVQQGMTNEYKNSSYLMAQLLAEKSLANFVKSSVYTYSNAEKITSVVQTAYKDLISSKGKDEATGGNKTAAVSYSHLEEVFSSTAQMSLTGVKLANRWNKQFEDYGVAGVIMYYSLTSVAQAKQEKKEINGQLDKVKKPAVISQSVPKAQGNIIRSKNIDVDDF